MNFVMLNGRPVPKGEALVSVQDRGFRYGDGLFETLRVHAGVPYGFEWHKDRLARGLAAIRISYDIDALQAQCAKLLSMNSIQDGILRIQVTRGVGSRGYLPALDYPLAGATSVIETASLPKMPQPPIILWLSRLQRISPQALPVHIKICQGLNSTLARIEADEHGCFDALQLNAAEHLCETSSANLFWVKDGTLYTPAPACGILDGSTRAAIIRLSPSPVQEVAAGIDALMRADGVFITNSVWGALPVTTLKPLDIGWDSEEETKPYAQALAADRTRYAKERHEQWKVLE